jgi:adenosine deaminase
VNPRTSLSAPAYRPIFQYPLRIDGYAWAARHQMIPCDCNARVDIELGPNLRATLVRPPKRSEMLMTDVHLPPGVRLPSLLAPSRDGYRSLVDPEVLAEILDVVWRVPKVELHLHLEGALRPETVCELAAKYDAGSPLCRPDWQDGYWSFRDLSGFVVELGRIVQTCLCEADDYYRIAVEVFEDLAAQNVVHAELNLSPRLPDHPRYIPMGDMLAAIDQARRDVEGRTPLRVGLLLGINRGRVAVGNGEAERLAVGLIRDGLRAREAGVALAGVDLHGDERAVPGVEPFAAAYRLAGEAGLGLRAHAGEATGARTVRESVERLGLQRVAHGVRSTEDPTLVAHLAARGVTLDICPTSNVLTGAVGALEAHPIRDLRDAGVKVTVSSDDPLVFNTTVTSELALLRHRLGFSFAELGELTAQAAAAAFLPAERRASLIDAVRDGWRAVPPEAERRP